MSLGNIKMERYLMGGHLAISAALDSPDLLVELKNYTYNKDRLNLGLGMYTETYHLYHVQQQDYVAQYLAAEKLEEIFKEAKGELSNYRRLARLALRAQPSLMPVLGLDSEAKRTLGGWMQDARLFYSNSLDDTAIMKKLNGFGVTRTKLKKADKLVDNVEKAAAKHEAAKGKALLATKERNKAFKDFKAWMKNFRQVCRVAFAKSPQKLEKMGMKAKS
ncbi:MAG: hypothetical protein GY940_40625 [bacterium]|nr:hypothetical protein [bacterium]